MNGSLTDSHPLSTAVVEAVADAEDVDPCDLPQPLADVVDPDALDALFRDRSDTDGQVRFEYAGYDIVAASDGTIEVQDPVNDA